VPRDPRSLLAGDEFRQPTAGRGDVLPEGDTPHPGKIIDMAMLVAPGLSGAAVIDECGIAIGLVSMIPALQDDEEGAALVFRVTLCAETEITLKAELVKEFP
jgi:hypothetical protein